MKLSPLMADISKLVPLALDEMVGDIRAASKLGEFDALNAVFKQLWKLQDELTRLESFVERAEA